MQPPPHAPCCSACALRWRQAAWRSGWRGRQGGCGAGGHPPAAAWAAAAWTTWVLGCPGTEGSGELECKLLCATAGRAASVQGGIGGKRPAGCEGAESLFSQM